MSVRCGQLWLWGLYSELEQGGLYAHHPVLAFIFSVCIEIPVNKCLMHNFPTTVYTCMLIMYKLDCFVHSKQLGANLLLTISKLQL